MAEEQFTFFFTARSPFSQWYICNFHVDGFAYNCTEQYMMHQKALLFGDIPIAELIMKRAAPGEQKKLGRQVNKFDATIWDEKCAEIVYNGNYAKFTQNENLKKYLLKTIGTTLVEASPKDTIWGIGLTEYDPDALDRSKWRGRNLLGEILTKLRDDLIAQTYK